METVLGVSMTPTAVRMVLVEGENAEGVTVDTDKFEVPATQDSAPTTAPRQVVSAILGTREGAAASGCPLASTGVTWTDPAEAAALRDLLAGQKVEKVMLVAAFLAAAALAQTVGNATHYAQTALLFVEPDTATMAVVDTADGSVSDVRRQELPDDDHAAVATLTAMAAGVEAMEPRPDGVFVVGSDGVDVGVIKAQLQAATSLVVSTPEEPELALARGAALASANPPLFASSTTAIAYAQDAGTGAVNPHAVALAHLGVPAGVEGAGDEALAYSADPDEDAEAATALIADPGALGAAPAEQRTTKPFLVAMSVLALFVGGVVALVLALAVAIRPHVDTRPQIGASVVAPATPAPPPPAAPAPAAPAKAPAAPAPAPAPAAPPLPAPPPGLPLPAPPLPAGPPGPPLPGLRPPIPGGPHGPPIPGPRPPIPVGPPPVPVPHIPLPGLPGIPGL